MVNCEVTFQLNDLSLDWFGLVLIFSIQGLK